MLVSVVKEVYASLINITTTTISIIVIVISYYYHC